MFNYILDESTIVFTDSLKADFPYISYEPRDHESIFFVTKGMVLYENCGTKCMIDEGQIGYIGKGNIDKSSAYNCDEASYISFNFSFGIGNKATLPFKTLCSDGVAYNYEKLFGEALNSFLMKQPGSIAVCNGLLLQIIGLIYSELEITDDRRKKMNRIEKAIEHMKNNYQESELSIGSLAEKCSMSEKNFRRIFSSVYKKTPYAFLQEFRINKAEILLLNTSKTVTEIAFCCGFSDVYSFSHSFKRHTGLSPIEYRNK